mmetsp:Transcript_37786/g.89010  ORF Transcript_37786/g.89010 Transcript_37786/m.89010 type:complete len:109 (-) Transcript_37786:203-529(-)|eukprot:3211702-Rhodomonas_salina.1
MVTLEEPVLAKLVGRAVETQASNDSVSVRVLAKCPELTTILLVPSKLDARLHSRVESDTHKLRSAAVSPKRASVEASATPKKDPWIVKLLLPELGALYMRPDDREGTS